MMSEISNLSSSTDFTISFPDHSHFDLSDPEVHQLFGRLAQNSFRRERSTQEGQTIGHHRARRNPKQIRKT